MSISLGERYKIESGQAEASNLKVSVKPESTEGMTLQRWNGR